MPDLAEVEKALAAYTESGLPSSVFDAELGGMQLPFVVHQAASAWFQAACVGAFASAGVQLSAGNSLGVAATSWGGQRLDCVVVQELADGDLYRVAALDHLWSDDGGEGFGIETFSMT